MFHVTLSDSSGASISKPLGIGTIINDDSVSMIINHYREEEGHTGTTDFNFRVVLTTTSSEAITAKYRTIEYTAKDSSDYKSSTGTITFNPGDNNTTITIKVNGDTKIEEDEIFYVELYDASGATIMAPLGKGVIVNDDYSSLSINDVKKEEGNSGITPFTFTVSLDQVDIEDVTVTYTTYDNAATTADSDYEAKTEDVTISAGENNATFTIDVNGDTKVEPDEDFYVILSNATSNHTISDNNGTGTILNDDEVTISITDVNLTEGNSGLKAFDFNVTLSVAHHEKIELSYIVKEGTATADIDYKDKSDTIIFEPGDTLKHIVIYVKGDLIIEPDETFNVILTSTTNNVSFTKNDGKGTILNDDSGYNTNEITFNVERTNSGDNPTIFSDERNAWYTQVSGRTFAYDVVVYDKTPAPYTLTNVVVKVDLLSQNNSIDTRYAYFDGESRVRLENVIIDEASKDARFVVTVLTNGSGEDQHIIYKQDCSTSASLKACYNKVAKNLPLSTDQTSAKDNFAIRPAGYSYTITAQGENPLIDNATPNDSSIHLGAEVTYGLLVKALRYDDRNTSTINDYHDITTKLALTFALTSANCNDSEDRTENIDFQNGVVYTAAFDINQTGKYTLSILDENWTLEDQNDNADCITGSAAITAGINDKQGCNIISKMTLNETKYTDQTITVYPAKFKVDLEAGSKPSDLAVIYMHSIKGTDNTMSKQIDVNITAQSWNDINLTNFTNGCMAEELNVDMNFSSIPALRDILDSNDENRSLYLSINDTDAFKIQNDSTEYTLDASAFEDNKEGSAALTLNYNIDRAPINTDGSPGATRNPVKVTFSALNVDSPNAYNNQTPTTSTTPKGTSSTTVTDTFLYARVRSIKPIYEESDTDPVSITLGIDVYCLVPELNDGICENEDTNLTYGIKTSLSGSGWWLSTRYADTNKIAKTTLEHKENKITISDGDDFIIPNNANEDDEEDKRNAINTEVTVTCPNNLNDVAKVYADEDKTSPWLLYENPLFSVRCKKLSNWAGKGKEKSVLGGATVTQSFGGKEDPQSQRTDAANLNETHRLSW